MHEMPLFDQCPEVLSSLQFQHTGQAAIEKALTIDEPG